MSSPVSACSAATGSRTQPFPSIRVIVRERAEVRLAADVEEWASRFSGNDTPAAVGEAARRFETAHLEYARDGGAMPLAQMLAALTALEVGGRPQRQEPADGARAASAFRAGVSRHPCRLKSALNCGSQSASHPVLPCLALARPTCHRAACGRSCSRLIRLWRGTDLSRTDGGATPRSSPASGPGHCRQYSPT